MAVAQASLAGNAATDVRVSIPAWGASYADVVLSVTVTLSGAVALVVGDLTIQGTVLTGGPAGDAGRSFYRIIAGAGGWGKSIPAKAYANDLGVKLATVLADAAQAAGETLDQTTVDQTARLGPAYTRPAGPACRVLELHAPGKWYVGEDGKTRLGARAASTLAAGVARTSDLDLARGTLTIASPTIAGVLPGLVVDGLTVVDVEHEFTAAAGLRSRIWGAQAGGTSRRLAALRRIFDQLDPGRKFRGIYEYRIVTQDGERLNLQPVRVSTGMPNLGRVFVRPGVPGCKATHALGARVLVGFADADPAHPVVISFVDAEDGSFLPTTLSVNASSSIQIGGPGGNPVARLGDQVTSFLPPTLVVVGTVSGSPFTGTITVLNPITGTITGGSAKATST